MLITGEHVKMKPEENILDTVCVTSILTIQRHSNHIIKSISGMKNLPFFCYKLINL